MRQASRRHSFGVPLFIQEFQSKFTLSEALMEESLRNKQLYNINIVINSGRRPWLDILNTLSRFSGRNRVELVLSSYVFMYKMTDVSEVMQSIHLQGTNDRLKRTGLRRSDIGNLFIKRNARTHPIKSNN